MSNSLLIIGAGGHAHVLIDILQAQTNVTILGILEENPAYLGKEIMGFKVLGSDEQIHHYSAQQVKLVNGIGSVGIPKHRQALFKKFKSLGYEFISVIHANVSISKNAHLGEGVQIMAGSVIQPNVHIGDNVIVNTRVGIDHDCYIGDHAHLAPGATLCGEVTIGEMTHIGTGAIIVQGINIGKNSLVGAGAVVIRDVSPSSKVMGLPAKKIKIMEDEQGEKLA